MSEVDQPLDALLDDAQAAITSGRFDEALAACDRAALLAPDDVLLRRRRAMALKLTERVAEALDELLAARQVAPEDVDVLNELGLVLVRLHRWEEAVVIYRQALALAPRRYDITSHLGIALVDLDRFGEALVMFRQAFAIEPRNARVVANLGNFLDFAGDMNVALAAYSAAASLSPGDRDIACNHGMALLRAGRLIEGWDLFEYRRRPQDRAEQAGIPRLPDPAAAMGKRVLVFHEQGLGDSLQFLRYIPLLAAEGADIVLRMPPPLTRLARAVTGVAAVIGESDDPGPLDYQIPMMSLPRLFGTDLGTIPAKLPYLHPPAASVAHWAARLAGETRPKIGLVWAGSPLGGLDHRRSTEFARFRPLLHFDACFVNLQIGRAGRQWQAGPGALDPTAALDDFAETAALIANLDLVIAVDTSTAHVAGGLGKPVWLLSRFDSCWRWLLGRDDSPWYPSLRLFRQSRPGDWDGVIAAVSAALPAFIANLRI